MTRLIPICPHCTLAHKWARLQSNAPSKLTVYFRLLRLAGSAPLVAVIWFEIRHLAAPVYVASPAYGVKLVVRPFFAACSRVATPNHGHQ